MTAPDPDPLDTTWMTEAEREFYEERPRSGAVILYLAVILVAIATGAIIALLWWGLR
jgi:hypothetical protein